MSTDNKLVITPATGRQMQIGTPDATEFSTLVAMANALAQSGMPLPSGCRTAQAILGKFLVGREYGIPPMVSLHKIHWIEGQATLPPAMTVAIIRRDGFGNIETVSVDDQKATVRVTRADWPVDRSELVTYTMDDAKKAQLSEKKNWKKWPQEMLLQRAQSRAESRYFQDALFGRVYSPDELGRDTNEAGEIIDVEFVTPAAPVTPPGVVVAPPAEAPTQDSATQPPATALDAAPVAASAETPLAAESPIAAEIKSLVATLTMPQDDWRSLLSTHNAAKLAELSPDRAIIVRDHLIRIDRLRRLRVAAGMPDEKYHAAITKRGCDRDTQLIPAAVRELYDKVYDLVAPFERQKLGIDPPESAGNPQSPASLAPAL